MTDNLQLLHNLVANEARLYFGEHLFQRKCFTKPLCDSKYNQTDRGFI